MQRICPVRAVARVAPVMPHERIAPLPFHTIIVGEGLVSVVEIQFASGTRYYSFEGVSAPGMWWKDAVLSISEFTREVPVVPGEYRVSDANVVLDNTDLEFSILKATETFRNVKLVIRHGDASHGVSGLRTVYTGEIAHWEIGTGTCSLRVRDMTYDRFRENIAGTFLPTDFPNMPQDYLGHVIPIIMGLHWDTAVPATRGVLPAYLVDPAVGSAEYVYVIARHPCVNVFEVFHNRVLLAPSAYTLAVQAFGPYQCQVIKFATDMQVAEGTDEFEITVNADGMGPAGDATGPVMENPVDQFRFALINYMDVMPDEIDAVTWEMCRASFEPRYNFGALAILGFEVSREEVIARFQSSFNLFLQPTRFGTMGLYSLKLDHELPWEGSADFSDQEDILRNSFRVSGYPDPISRLVYQYSWQHAFNFFLRRPHHIDEEEEARLKRDVRDTLDLWYVRDDFTATTTVIRRHGYVMEGVQLVTFDLPERFFGLELNMHFVLTHWEGIAADGLGYPRVLCRITAMRHRLDPTSMRVTIDAVRIPPAPVLPQRADFAYAHGWRTRGGRLEREDMRVPELVEAGVHALSDAG
jgi:hypothetical protein